MIVCIISFIIYYHIQTTFLSTASFLRPPPPATRPCPMRAFTCASKRRGIRWEGMRVYLYPLETAFSHTPKFEGSHLLPPSHHPLSPSSPARADPRANGAAHHLSPGAPPASWHIPSHDPDNRCQSSPGGAAILKQPPALGLRRCSRGTRDLRSWGSSRQLVACCQCAQTMLVRHGASSGRTTGGSCATFTGGWSGARRSKWELLARRTRRAGASWVTRSLCGAQ